MKTEKFDRHTQRVVDAYVMQHPQGSEGDLLRAVYRSDRGRFSYWFKFILALVCRWYIIAFVAACTTPELNEWISADMHLCDSRGAMISGFLLHSLLYMPWFAWADLVNCVVCYFGYRVDPSGGDLYEVLSKGTYERCTQRVINYVLWTLIVPIILFFGVMITIQ